MFQEKSLKLFSVITLILNTLVTTEVMAWVEFVFFPKFLIRPTGV